MRDTKQRDALHAVLEASTKPLSIKELYEKTQKRYSRDNPGRTDLSQATIYRNIAAMMEAGTVRTVNGIGIPQCYCDVKLMLPEVMYQCNGSLFTELPKGFSETTRVTIIAGETK